MAVTWPTSLPQLPERSTYKRRVGDGRIITNMQQGAPKVRRIYSNVPDTFALSYVCNAAQWLAFDTFWETTLNGGTLTIDLKVKTSAGITTIEVQPLERDDDVIVSDSLTRVFIYGGISMTQLLDEVYSSGFSDRFYITLEFNHSAFRDTDDNPTHIRLVSGFEDLTATLEAGAPYDESTEVTFTASAFAIKEPEKGINGRQEMPITIDAASGEIIQQLERVSAATREPIKVTYRVFVESDLTAPQNVPLTMTLINPTVTPESVSAVAVFSDVLNKSFPSINYTTTSHPGLA